MINSPRLKAGPTFVTSPALRRAPSLGCARIIPVVGRGHGITAPLALVRSVLILGAALLLMATGAPRPSPADLYGDLFEAVQLGRVFPDGKTFVDAVPKRSPEAIMAAYHAERPTSPEALRAFVIANFDLPESASPSATTTKRQSLSTHIAGLWPVLTRPPLDPVLGSSALALPEPYVVPGGRFREIYYWDSYFTMLGLAEDGRQPLIESMLADFENLIERFGRIPNGTRTYYLSRSQPPFFALMADLSRERDPETLRRRLTALRREHEFWMAGTSCLDAAGACQRVVRMPDGSQLNRYFDDRDTPRDESFAEDVATAAESGRPKGEVYRDLRAGAESGWDFSSRWLTDPAKLASVRTTEIVPIDLNSLLWTLELAIARRCTILAEIACANDFQRRAVERRRAIVRYLWLPAERRFADWDRVRRRPTGMVTAATLYPLFVGLATSQQARAVTALTREKLVAPGGLRTTLTRTGQQWDAPNGWAPLQWVAVLGLARYGEEVLARDIAARWIETVNAAYQDTGRMLEKYDVEERRPGGGGEYPLQDGFGWTNGVTRALIARFPDAVSEKTLN